MAEETKIKERVTKKIIVGTIQNYTGAVVGKRWNKEDATVAYDSFLASLKGLILTYGEVSLPGIGTFEIKIRKGKKIPNNFGLGDDKDWCYSKDKQILSFDPSPTLSESIIGLPYTFVNNNNEDGGDE